MRASNLLLCTLLLVLACGDNEHAGTGEWMLAQARRTPDTEEGAAWTPVHRP